MIKMANKQPAVTSNSQVQINDKITKYETFINDQLRPDLENALQERDKIYAEIAEFLALKNSIEAIKASKLLPGEPLKTKVDLGSNFYCQAVVSNPNRIFVAVGLGMYLNLSGLFYRVLCSRLLKCEPPNINNLFLFIQDFS
jgi:prefoldin subunit 5